MYIQAFKLVVQIAGPIVGHVGDGNFHVFYPVHTDDKETLHKIHDVSHRMAL